MFLRNHQLETHCATYFDSRDPFLSFKTFHRVAIIHQLKQIINSFLSAHFFCDFSPSKNVPCLPSMTMIAQPSEAPQNLSSLLRNNCLHFNVWMFFYDFQRRNIAQAESREISFCWFCYYLIKRLTNQTWFYLTARVSMCLLHCVD